MLYMVYRSFKTILLEKGKSYFHENGRVCAVFPVNETFRPGRYYCLVRPINDRVYYIHRIVNCDLSDVPLEDDGDTEEVCGLYVENPCPYSYFPYKYQHRTI